MFSVKSVSELLQSDIPVVIPEYDEDDPFIIPPLIYDKRYIRNILNNLDKKSGYDSSNIPIIIINNMQSALGAYIHYADNKPIAFCFNYYLCTAEVSENAFYSVVAHEYCHYIRETHRSYESPVASNLYVDGHDDVFRSICKEYNCNPNPTGVYDNCFSYMVKAMFNDIQLGVLIDKDSISFLYNALTDNLKYMAFGDRNYSLFSSVKNSIIKYL